VLGRVEPVRVYEIIAPAGCLSAAEQELCGLFAEGLATYRARDWDQWKRCFAQCLAVMPRGRWRAVGAERPDRDAASPGTEGSNPACSSGESANFRCE
jgi:adenylate cyclase